MVYFISICNDKESYFKNEYKDKHLYLQHQCQILQTYIRHTDLNIKTSTIAVKNDRNSLPVNLIAPFSSKFSYSCHFKREFKTLNIIGAQFKLWFLEPSDIVYIIGILTFFIPNKSEILNITCIITSELFLCILQTTHTHQNSYKV